MLMLRQRALLSRRYYADARCLLLPMRDAPRCCLCATARLRCLCARTHARAILRLLAAATPC